LIDDAAAYAARRLPADAACLLQRVMLRNAPILPMAVSAARRVAGCDAPSHEQRNRAVCYVM